LVDVPGLACWHDKIVSALVIEGIIRSLKILRGDITARTGHLIVNLVVKERLGDRRAEELENIVRTGTRDTSCF
jgi:hypothetical protein